MLDPMTSIEPMTSNEAMTCNEVITPPEEALTPTERRVAQLAFEGMTNRAIAGTLFLSTKTVEANLSRVYRKLGISSRAGLAGAL
jgi:DNA-binding NarL/FixJ family response regulator